MLRRYSETSPLVRLYRLAPGADFAVMPIDDALQDDLHRRYGTGEWLDTVRLTLSDVAFAMETARHGPIAYLETDTCAGGGAQAAVLWGGGAVAIRPLSMTTQQSQARPRTTWPINAVLRGLGVVAGAGLDEFETFGLGAYRNNEVIRQKAVPIRF